MRTGRSRTQSWMTGRMRKGRRRTGRRRTQSLMTGRMRTGRKRTGKVEGGSELEDRSQEDR